MVYYFTVYHIPVASQGNPSALTSNNAKGTTNTKEKSGTGKSSATVNSVSSSSPVPVTVYMGKDKFENEELLKYAFDIDVWFHVDKLSSAHVYLRPPSEYVSAWGCAGDAGELNLPVDVMDQCAQLVKHNSIEGSKRDNLTVIFTMASNLLKTGDMATGAVSFHKSHKVKRHFVKEKIATVLNPLLKGKREEVDPDLAGALAEYQKAQKRLAVQRAKDLKVQAAAEKAKYAELAEAKSYSFMNVAEEEMHSNKATKPGRTVREVTEIEEDFM